MEFLCLIPVSIFVGFCIGCFSSEMVFKVSTAVSVFLGLLFVYFGWDMSQNQTGDVFGGVGAMLGLMFFVIALFRVGGF